MTTTTRGEAPRNDRRAPTRGTEAGAPSRAQVAAPRVVRIRPRPSPRLARDPPDAAGIRDVAAVTLAKARDHLLSLQDPRGWWIGELETNVTMDAEDVLLRHFLGILTEVELAETAGWIRSQQREDGTWANFYGGPGDLSTTVEAYVALKLAGDPADAPHMTLAADWITANGGLTATRVFTRIWLAISGLWSWDELPVIPPEVIYLPSWVPLNIYDWGCWARQTIVALAVVSSFRPSRPLPFPLDELYARVPGRPPKADNKDPWSLAFNGLDKVLHKVEPRLPKRARRAARRRCADWIIARQEADGCWGGIQPPWVYSIMALHLMGYGLDSPVVKKAIDALERFTIREDGIRRLEACQSPVWDTVLSMIALADAGLEPDHPALTSSADWVLDEEIRQPGDWQVRRPDTAPGGWAFEFDNDNYPDTDDAAEVILALRRTGTDNRAAIRRGLRWLEGMQCKDGGWGAFDADNTRQLVNKLPFCDFGAVIDPPSADVTAHIVEAFAAEGLAHETACRRGRHLAAQAPGGRRLLVRPLGRELPLRHRRGRSRADRGRRQAGQAADPPRRRLAGGAPERGRRLGRGPALLRRPEELVRPGRVHRLADRLGAARAARGGRGGGQGGRARHPLAGGDAAPGRHLGRALLHRDRLPGRLLPELPPVPAGVPGLRARQIRKGFTS